MKKLILIGGTMGVGKSATSHVLKKTLERSVFLDGDWCWDMHPFVVNDETKTMVLNNIVYNLNQFIHCSEIDHIILGWVMHQQEIVDEILSRLDLENCRVYHFSLICDENTLIQHIQRDIEKGIRQPDVIQRSLERMKFYDQLDSVKIDVSGLSLDEVVKKITHHII